MGLNNTLITPTHILLEEIKREDRLVHDGEYYLTVLGSLIIWKGREPFHTYPTTLRYRRIPK